MANSKASQAASLLGKRSVRARRAAWGEEVFKSKLRAWGKLGGRPRKDAAATKGGSK
ncbi:MAG: hypothetical protein ACRD2F_00110 [Terriglobales bacterium]